jgi:hypothetical protein
MVIPKGTQVTGAGVVVFRDETVYGLQRMCIEAQGLYPDLELWSQMLIAQTAVSLWRHRYTERVTGFGCRCFLWLYWKGVR